MKKYNKYHLNYSPSSILNGDTEGYYDNIVSSINKWQKKYKDDVMV